MRWTQEDLDNYRTKFDQAMEANGAPMRVPMMPACLVPKTKPNKFRNVKTTDAQGIVHDGKGECERWQELRLLELAGSIRGLRRQVPYALVVEGILIAKYIADFVYEDGAATIVEDHKSPRTRKLESFRHKVKLMQALHKIQIREVTK